MSKKAPEPKKSGGDDAAGVPGRSPAGIGAYGAMLIGLVFAAFGGQSLVAEPAPPLPYSAALCAVGALAMLLGWRTLRCSRAAWSFLIALFGTGTVVFLFGAPRLRDGFEIPLAAAFVPAMIFAAICVLLAVDSERF